MKSIVEICQNGGTNELIKMIDDGMPFNSPDENGMYPIHYAALFGNEAVIRVLIKYGADVNVQTINGKTPLHFAVQGGRLTLTRILLHDNANPAIVDSQKNNALTLACKRGYLPIAEYILLHSNGLAPTAIDYCCKENYINLIRMFIDYVTPQELMEGLSKMNLSKWGDLSSKLMVPSGDFTYEVDCQPFDKQLCDYFINSTPPLDAPLNVHSSIVFNEIPYFALIPSNSQISLSPEPLIVMLNYCYTHTIDSLLLSHKPITYGIEILRLSHPQRLGAIVPLITKVIEQIIQSDLSEISILVEFFKTQDHRYFYESLFQGLISTLLKHISVPSVLESVQSLPRGFIDDMINLLPTQYPDIQLPNYNELKNLQW
ncbi:hypothetical protein ENUP19_0082G0029 [Entamoeba nuttalli]|uniref:Ankyrin repeat protein, putative n=2 Tax=Entamoeba nuttalli TaxID=412467 RepID=K2H751_ENTNP|nr:ankyrin repeat protein, putative [Entamoeba nuttalli P19]EKE42387.1 ankyrin repeat protein, putative [Entamoeba nuttalli P19]|eukprot:XP_008855268.1 ankyrin repeat protein, putative [Entamoeba nuttalli P19]